MSILAEAATEATSEIPSSSPIATSGTAITIDPDTGFPDVLIINASYGLGHTVSEGLVCPDEYRLFKPFIDQEEKDPLLGRTLGSKSVQEIYTTDPEHPFCQELTSFDSQHHFALSEAEIRTLANAILNAVGPDEAAEIEWLHEAGSETFAITRIRPLNFSPPQLLDSPVSYELQEEHPHLIIEGIAIGHQMIRGTVVKQQSPDDSMSFPEGSILVADHVDQSWRPLLEKAGGLVTDSGGRVCQAAMLARELGLPAILGTAHATTRLKDHQEITLDCSRSDVGHVYRHHLEFRRTVFNQNGLPHTRTRRLLSIDSPDAAQSWWQLPAQGFGLAKIENIIAHEARIHPRALLEYDEIGDDDLKLKIDRLTASHESREDYYIDRLSRGIARMAAQTWPRPCVVRLNDFTSEEYHDLLERGLFEPLEHNPKLGLRGASRYLSPDYRASFELECQALQRARHEAGFTNIHVAIPFCRTVEGARKVIDLLDEHGLVRGKRGLQLHLIAEVPSNIVLGHEFMRHFDRLDIDLNTLTQLVLSIDPDDPTGSNAFDHNNPAVLAALKMLVDEAHRAGSLVTIFGLLEDHRSELIDYLLDIGIDAFAFKPQNFLRGSLQVAENEKRFLTESPTNPNEA